MIIDNFFTFEIILFWHFFIYDIHLILLILSINLQKNFFASSYIQNLNLDQIESRSR